MEKKEEFGWVVPQKSLKVRVPGGTVRAQGDDGFSFAELQCSQFL